VITAHLILGYLEGAPGRRATFKQLLRDLHARGPERGTLKLALADLIRHGRVVERRAAFELSTVTAARAEAKAAKAGKSANAAGTPVDTGPAA